MLRGLALCCAFLIATSRASEGADSSLRTDTEAGIRALGFLDTLPSDNTINIGVVYSPATPQGKAQAQTLASILNGMPGPNSKSLHAEAMGVDELAQTQKRLDVLFLLPGSAGSSVGITDFIRRRHVVSISNDPACLDAHCCVLMVSTANGVNIVLDTALADSVGAHFSTVFAMMVKRR
jgi:hypothetical protein